MEGSNSSRWLPALHPIAPFASLGNARDRPGLRSVWPACHPSSSRTAEVLTVELQQKTELHVELPELRSLLKTDLNGDSAEARAKAVRETQLEHHP